MSADLKLRLNKPLRAEVVQVIREAIARELPKALRALCAPAAPAPRRDRVMGRSRGNAAKAIRTPAEVKP